METYIAVPGSLEIRQVGGARVLAGRFPYGGMATISDRGRVRKETFLPGAFRYSIEQDTSAKIDILVGHSFDKPIASRQAGSLVIADGPDAVTFEATLPTDPPTWVVDAELAIAQGLMTGLSPGFRIPPKSVVPNGETFAPEPGNPGVQIRQVRQAVLREFSVVTSGAYDDATVQLRAEGGEGNASLLLPKAVTLWL